MTLLILIAISLAPLAFIIAVLCAPVGYQDKTGFHYGDKGVPAGKLKHLLK